MQNEIRYLDGQVIRFQAIPKMSQFLLELGSKVCLYIFWDSYLWNNNSLCEQSSKRQKRTEKLEGLMELAIIDQRKFSWRW